MYDGPYCSERMGENYNAGSTGEEMAEFYGDPSNGDFDPDHVAEVERLLAEESLVAENARLRQENEMLREMLD